MQSLTHVIPFSKDPSLIVNLFKDQPYVFFLDSTYHDRYGGRYSFLGFDPFKLYTSSTATSLRELRSEFNEYQNNQPSSLTPFESGIVGFLSYDYGLNQEGVSRGIDKVVDYPLLQFGFYDAIITFDHKEKKLIVTSSGLPFLEQSKRLNRAESRLNTIVQNIESFLSNDSTQDEFSFDDSNVSLADIPFQSNFTQDEYIRAVDKALDYIAQGEIYQVNLSQNLNMI